MNSAQVPLNRDDGGLLPDTYLHLINKNRCSHDNFRSDPMKALERSFETWVMNHNFLSGIHSKPE